MAKVSDVLSFLLPEGGWVVYGENWDGVRFIEAAPITKAEFETGFAKFDAWKAEQDSAKATAKQALLDKLGITQEEAALLLGGN